MLLLNLERIGHLLARSLDRTSTELVSCTIERSNIGNLKVLNNSVLHDFISVFDVKLPTVTVLDNNIQFPGETKLNYSDIRGTAEIVVPTVILNQFSSKGMPIYQNVVTYNVFSL